MNKAIYAIQVQTGYEKHVSLSFKAQSANEDLDLDNIELQTLARPVVRYFTSGKAESRMENIVPGYIFLLCPQSDTSLLERIREILLNMPRMLKFVGEVTTEEFAQLKDEAKRAVVQIAEPDTADLAYGHMAEKVAARMDELSKRAKDVCTRTFAKLRERIEVLRKKKQQYLDYLRYCCMFDNFEIFRVIRGKRSVLEFPGELMEKLKRRHNFDTGGRAGPLVLAVFLAQEGV